MASARTLSGGWRELASSRTLFGDWRELAFVRTLLETGGSWLLLTRFWRLAGVGFCSHACPCNFHLLFLSAVAAHRSFCVTSAHTLLDVGRERSRQQRIESAKQENEHKRKREQKPTCAERKHSELCVCSVLCSHSLRWVFRGILTACVCCLCPLVSPVLSFTSADSSAAALHARASCRQFVCAPAIYNSLGSDGDVPVSFLCVCLLRCWCFCCFCCFPFHRSYINHS